MEAWFIPYGATLTHLLVPDKDGVKRDVALGWDDATQYCANAQHTYFGATIGRVANRIAKGSFDLDGVTYHTPLNDKGYDTLHGGWVGYDRRVWRVTRHSEREIAFTYTSPDGEEGFPGRVEVSVVHALSDDNVWSLAYSAKTNKPTIVSMTNHIYLNLNANVNNTPTVLAHEVSMPTADKFVEVDKVHLIPTGNIISVKSPASAYMDFTTPKPLGRDINKGTVSPLGGYDNAFLFAGWYQKRAVTRVVQVTSPMTGISVEMSTDQPSVQMYTGNFLNGTSMTTRIRRKASQSYGKDPQYYQWRGAFTLEAQQYPDAIHHPNFPSWRLEPGQTYEQHTMYKFSAQK